ncbi:MAG: DNA adenine methylase [Polyangiaceae bacterium]
MRPRSVAPFVPVVPAPEPPEHVVARPFLKWAGGKWSLAPRLAELLPQDLSGRTYREPFVGGGALFFWLRAHRPARRFVLSDALTDLVKTYEAVRDHPVQLCQELERLAEKHSATQFYEVREHFNHRGGKAIERAAWLIYLNKTCFNGLFRTNQSGKFNVPIGRFTNPRILDVRRIEAASRALAGVTLAHQSFEHLLEHAEPGDVIYLDPPYVPLSRTASFAGYSGGSFDDEDQAELAAVFRKLDERGCLLALSNSDVPEVAALYEGFHIERIIAPRVISSQASTRKAVTEVLVRNLHRYPRRRGK